MRAFHVRSASWAPRWLPSPKLAQNLGQLAATDKVPAGKRFPASEPGQGRTCPSVAGEGALRLASGAFSWLWLGILCCLPVLLAQQLFLLAQATSSRP